MKAEKHNVQFRYGNDVLYIFCIQVNPFLATSLTKISAQLVDRAALNT
jgi:hypothetical protein